MEGEGRQEEAEPESTPVGEGIKPANPDSPGDEEANRLTGKADDRQEETRDEEFISHVAAAVPEAVLCVDEGAKIVYANPAAERLWGYSARELEGKDLPSMVIPESLWDDFRRAFRSVIEEGGPWEGLWSQEFPSVRRDGSSFTVEISVSDFHLHGKRYFLALARDVSERRALEEALGKSEERYRILYDNSGYAVFSYDRSLALTSVNRVVTELLGYSEEELVGRNILELGVLYPDDYATVAASLGKLFCGERVINNELRFIRKDGSILVANIMGVPITNEEGDVVEVINIGHDITERKRIEEELEEHRRRLEELVESRTRELKEALRDLEHRERYFRALIENSWDIIVVLDEDGTLRYLSPSAERVSGFTPDEWLGKNPVDFIHPDDLQRLYEVMPEQLREKGRTNVLEYRWRHRDGSYHWHEAVAYNLLHDPAVRGIVVNARDVTERKEAERALRESEERYRTLVETSPDAIIVSDLEGKIIMINPAGAAMLGYESAAEVTGKNIFEFIALEDHARAWESMRDRPEDGAARREEYTLIRRDGSRIRAEISASLLRNAEGVPVGFIGITRDITDRKKMALGLERLNRCFLSLGHDPLENITNIVLAGGEILGARLARYSRRDKGKYFIFNSMKAEKGYVPVDHADRFICHHIITTRAAGPLLHRNLEPGIFPSDPDVAELGLKEGLFHLITLKGEPIGCLCFFFDNEKKYTAADLDILIMLVRAVAIEEDRFDYEEGLRSFIDIASHELRHPLALLSGYSEFLQEQYRELDDRTRKEILQAIGESSRRLNEIGEGLIRASLVERKRFEWKREAADPVELVRGIIEEMRERFPERKFHLTVEGEIGRHPLDPAGLRDVMLSLLDNAVKFSPPETEVEVILRKDAEGLEFRVLDRGTGIAEEYRSKIFDRFYQVEEAQHHSRPGLGLGLYLARRIVEDHGGSIHHEPRPGGGSVFRFILP
jgi:PAS domain S-box-containing protein